MDIPSIDMAGPGQVRPLSARWVIEGDVILISAAHVGGREEGPADLNVLRERTSNKPLLTGSSLAGALRGHLADILGGFRSLEHADVGSLFGRVGATDGELDTGDQSHLIVFDSVAELPLHRAEELRDGVAINAASGTAQAHKRFDLEVLPAGTRFPIRVELLAPSEREEVRLVSLLIAALSGLTPGNIALGARRARGLGGLRSERWRAVRYDLSKQTDWLAWLTSDPCVPIDASAPDHKDARDACLAAWPGAQLIALSNERRRVTARVQLHFSSGLLIRSAPTSADAPDAVHLSSGGQPILPGTSLAGVLRARARRILRVVRQQHGDAEVWLERLFGTEPGDRDKALSASRLRVSESVIRNAKPLRQTRVQIDRFTQGTAPTALFEEEPVFGGEVEVRIELRLPEASESPELAEVGLLLLLLKDLLTGDLVIGGTGSIGRGAVYGTATITLADGREFELAPGRTADATTEQALTEAIRALHHVPALSDKDEVA
jgi:CRISPR/Cas system CSM-associated protein Csm3 (group 7 of RAMP superfamily)